MKPSKISTYLYKGVFIKFILTCFVQRKLDRAVGLSRNTFQWSCTDEQTYLHFGLRFHSAIHQLAPASFLHDSAYDLTLLDCIIRLLMPGRKRKMIPIGSIMFIITPKESPYTYIVPHMIRYCHAKYYENRARQLNLSVRRIL